MNRAPVVALACLLAVSCAGGKPTHHTNPSPSAVAAARRYTDPKTIQQTLNAHGVNCGTYAPDARTPIGAVASGRCHSDAMVEVVIRTYSNHEGAAAQLDTLSSFGLEVDLLVGDNWTVNAYKNPQFVDRAKKVLGGEVWHVPASR
jgi:hypothetical protein